jgi:exonuclease III
MAEGDRVVCLQELKAPDERFPEAAIRAAGYVEWVLRRRLSG